MSLNSIAIIYGGTEGPCHGGSGGIVAKVTLGDEEYITAVFGRAGSYIDSMGFVTNKHSYGPYGVLLIWHINVTFVSLQIMLIIIFPLNTYLGFVISIKVAVMVVPLTPQDWQRLVQNWNI